MVGASVIIADRLRCPVAEKDRAGVFDTAEVLLRLCDGELEMLRRDGVGVIDAGVDVRKNDNDAVICHGLADDLSTGQRFKLTRNLALHSLRQRAESVRSTPPASTSCSH